MSTGRVRATPQATPGPSTQSRVSSSNLPEYQRPAFPLTPDAQRALASLASNNKRLKDLQDKLEEAAAGLSTSAGEINDRLTNKEASFQKSQARARRNTQNGDEPVDNAQAEQSLNAMREKVNNMTRRMDLGMRKTIDGKHDLEAIQKNLLSIATDARANASTQVSTQHRRGTQRGTAGEEGDDEGEIQDFTPTDPSGGTQAQPSPLDFFKKKTDDSKTLYQSYDLSRRYAANNDYRNFKRVVHDAQHPEDDVPVPHERTWFPEEAAPAPGVTTRGQAGEDDSDDDVAVSRATVSTKCPLTLQEFNQPYTSKKCPHSFEKAAILQMISQSLHKVGERQGPRGQMVGGTERFVQCPVPGCSSELTKDDLQTDDVLVRKIQRIQYSRKLAEEDDDEDDGDDTRRGNTQRRATILDDEDDDDDAVDVDDMVDGEQSRRPRVKPEPRSTAGASQPPQVAGRSTTSSGVQEISDGEHEDETMID
ncbi:hypothetical protein MBLNU230_g2924t1 [Neophaeotheca triangularis]